MARLARGDVNMPNYDGFPIHVQLPEVNFEAAVYELLRSKPSILASRLPYHRIPVQHVGPRLETPQNIAGRRLFLFERVEGENNVWCDLSSEDQVGAYVYLSAPLNSIVVPILSIGLYSWSISPYPRITVQLQSPTRLHRCLAPRTPLRTETQIVPHSRCSHTRVLLCFFTSKIEATVGNIGDVIGWEDDNNTVGLVAAAAKRSLLRLIPHIMPADNDQTSLYRLVIDHGDFGIHNMSITMDANGQPLVTSLYNWETACIVPAILSGPLMAVVVDLVTDENAAPSIIRVPDDATPNDHAQYVTWARQYLKVYPSF